MYILVLLKFTPLEFETRRLVVGLWNVKVLKFTPLEFETLVINAKHIRIFAVKIYSVGV